MCALVCLCYTRVGVEECCIIVMGALNVFLEQEKETSHRLILKFREKYLVTFPKTKKQRKKSSRRVRRGVLPVHFGVLEVS